jgi:glycosyltransferase involved in cell wall biosynthesis
MRISILTPPNEHYSPVSGGAVATVVMEQSKVLVARGHDLTILAASNSDPVYTIGHVVPLRSTRREALSIIQRRWAKLFEVIHGWDYPYYRYYLSSAIAALEELPKPPEAIVVHNDLVLPKYIRRAFPDSTIVCWLHNEWRTHLRRPADSLSCVDTFVTVSDYIRDFTADLYGLPPHKMVTIVNGVDPAVFSPRADFTAPSKPLKVLYIGRIDRNKGPDIAADAVAALKKQGVPIKFTVAGGLWFYGHGKEMDDPYFRQLYGKIEAVGGKYLGHVTRPLVPELIRQHDVVCVLSRSQDPCPLVTLEAMASGCAVLGSNRGGIPQSCGEAGLLVDPDDLSAVTEKLKLIASDPALLAQQKRLSVEQAARGTWAKLVDQMEGVMGAARVAGKARPNEAQPRELAFSGAVSDR